MPIIPPWLKGPDAGAEYARGLQTGASVAEAAARLDEADRRAQQTLQMHREQLQQQSALEQARLATATAYHQTETELQRQRLAETAKVNAARTQTAALKLAQQQKFTELSQTMNTRDAAIAAGLATPQLLSGMDKATSEEAARQTSEGLRAREVAATEQREKRLGAGAGQSVASLKAALDVATDPAEHQRIEDQIMEKVGARPNAIPLASRGAVAPFKEGALIRSKKDGKLHRIQNGVPVPVNDQSAEREGE